MSFRHYPLSHPLPKLRLSGPKLFAVPADNQGSFLLLGLFLLVLVGAHLFSLKVSLPHR